MVCWQEGVQEQLAGLDQDLDEKHITALEQSGVHASVVLRLDCTTEDILEAYVHSYLVLHAKQPLVCSPPLRDPILMFWCLESTVKLSCPIIHRGALSPLDKSKDASKNVSRHP